MVANSLTNETVWTAPRRDAAAERVLCNALGISPLLAACLIARDLSDPDEANAFLNPKLDDLHDPMLLPDADIALKEIMGAKERDELIYVHGDYDVDGVTSTAIWARSLSKLGFRVEAHVPHRMKEGYGIHESAIREAIDLGAKLLLTCDCGTSAISNLAIAREAGMRVVVTDHHQLGADVPDVHALVNPHRPDSKYPFQELCGAAVAFKMAQAVSEACGVSRAAFQRAYMDLVCLGTIADIVALVGENRIFAAHGLKALGETKKVGLQALLRICELDPKAINSRDVGFKISPRLNAAGRVDDAEHSLTLLMTDDPVVADKNAKLLDEHNRARQTEERRILQQAEEIILENELQNNPLIFVCAPDWHKGVVGIVANRIVDRFYRPTLVGSINEETGMIGGSARSIPSFHLNEALQANVDLFTSCGGHEMAAGFSFPVERLDEVTTRLVDYARKALTPDDLTKKRGADAQITQSELSHRAIAELEKMQPFGAANPGPTFIVSNAKLEGIKPCRNEQHIQFTVAGQTTIRGIAFSMAPSFEGIANGDSADLFVDTAFEKFNGSYHAKVILRELRRTAQPLPD